MNNEKVEYAIVSALVSSKNENKKTLFKRFIDQVKPEFFQNHKNTSAITAIKQEYDARGSIMDEYLLVSCLNERFTSSFSAEEAQDYVSYLSNKAFYSETFESYMLFLVNSWGQRYLNYIASKTTDHLTSGEPLDECIESLQKGISKIQSLNAPKAATFTYNEVTESLICSLQETAQRESHLSGLETGFNELDDLTLGLQEADLVVVAARPSMGKTTFATNITDHVSDAGGNVLLFTLEMPAEHLLKKTCASLGSINQNTLKSGRFSESESKAFSEAIKKVRGWKSHIVDEGRITVEQIGHICREHHDKEPLSLVMIDYLQLIKGNEKLNNKNDQVGEITRALKLLAKELKCPIILLSQLSRSLESRANKRPINSDLRDSGSIEQDADIIIFIYRDEVYNPDTEDKGIAEIIVSKHRNGSLGNFKVGFQGQYSRFVNIGEDIESYDPTNPVYDLLNSGKSADWQEGVDVSVSDF